MATHLADAGQITQLLQRWQRGDRAALDTLMPLVYDELRRLARSRLRREPADNSVHATTLVHEVYLRLVNERAMNWQSRAHFLGVAAQLMRFILVDHCRRKYNDKRGGRLPRVPLDEATVVSCEAAPRLLALDQALKALAAIDARKGRVAELRFFGGLTVEETAEVLGVAPVTVLRDWKLARAWLKREME